MSAYIPQLLSRRVSFELLMKLLMKSGLNLASSTGSDAFLKQRTIFLSIDIEGTARNGQCVNEVGVSILDTNDLDPTSSKPYTSIIKSLNFRTQPKYWYSKPTKPFLFGITEDVPPNELTDLFQRITLG
ncbi:hypothetical protein N431DRAFT_450071 [Stipitochalara longipes BDJ]|nr:hypothetical protein N431DRAFT_450071 [Stipitochalara longipes BDJ]